MLSRRFVLSLIAALSLSTLALANSATVNMTSLHSGTSAYSAAYTYPSHFSTTGEKTTSVMFDASNHISMGENGNTQGGGLLSGKGAFARDTAYYTTGRIAGPGGMHPARFGDDKWVGGAEGAGCPHRNRGV